MVVTKGQRTETAEEVEDLAAVLVDVIHALGTLDLDLVEAQKLHEVILAGIEMRLEQVRHPLDIQRLGVFHGKKRRLGNCCRRKFRCLNHRLGIDFAGFGHDCHLPSPTRPARVRR